MRKRAVESGGGRRASLSLSSPEGMLERCRGREEGSGPVRGRGVGLWAPRRVIIKEG